MRWAHLRLFTLVFAWTVGCDLFPQEAPRTSVADAGYTGAAGAVGDADVSDGTAGSVGGEAGAGDAAGQGPDLLTIHVSSSADDVNQDHSDWQPSRPRVWIGTASHKQASYVGFRFSDLMMPAGAKVESATLELYVPTDEASDLSVVWGAEATDDCPPLSASEPLSSREPTEATMPYAPGEPWAADSWVEIEGLGPIVSEVVSRPGWKPGQAICVAARGTGEAGEMRFVASYDGSPSFAPRLTISYTLP